MAGTSAHTEEEQKPLTWFITGCSSGFGLALTRVAQAHGHKVIATSRNPSRTPELVKEITDKGGQWLELNVDDASCGQVIEDLEDQGTAIDVLINSAGFGQSGPVEHFNEDEVRALMDTNFFGPFRLIRAVTPRMRKRRSGMIVNISSGAGMEARNTLGVYGASKAALDDLTKVLHKEMQDFNVRVLLVYLGTFNTPMIEKVNKVAHPIDPDYEGTLTKTFYDALSTGNFKAPNDYRKATRAMYEIITRQGIGKDIQNEMMLPLGSDMGTRVYETRDRLNHMMDVFGDICFNVKVDTDPEEKEKAAA